MEGAHLTVLRPKGWERGCSWTKSDGLDLTDDGRRTTGERALQPVMCAGSVESNQSVYQSMETEFVLLPARADVTQRDGGPRRSMNFRCCCDGHCHDADVVLVAIEKQGTDGWVLRPLIRLGPHQVMGSDQMLNPAEDERRRIPGESPDRVEVVRRGRDGSSHPRRLS